MIADCQNDLKAAQFARLIPFGVQSHGRIKPAPTSGERSNTCNYLLTVCALSSTHNIGFVLLQIRFLALP